jgi:arabinogalactan endo-1,4-beta-galactosidase
LSILRTILATLGAAAAAVCVRPAVGDDQPRRPDHYVVGADISWVQQAEDRGTRFSEGGDEDDILAILKRHGFNFIRLRVFHDPTKPTPKDRPYSREGYCDLDHTVAMARRVKAADMGLLVDFHYSDSWADPGKQFTPSEWADLPFDGLVEATRTWTRDAVLRFRDAGATPDIVQVGNEITPGLMTDRGGSTRDWEKLGRLLKAGLAGVREADPAILTMLHIDRSGDAEAARWWVDKALAQGVAFDILGLSCYRRWHGPPETWKATFEDLAERYPRLSFLVVEMAVEVAETNRIMLDLPEGRGLGTVIWEPTSNLNGQALFDRTGTVIPDRMRLYDELAEEFRTRRAGATPPADATPRP